MSAVGVVGVASATIVLTATLIGASALVPAMHEARAAADASAMAAADELLWLLGEPCESAARVARAGGAELEACDCDTRDCWLTVRVWSGLIPLTASARAGAP